MRLAIFGGTFDPIHTGHLLMAESACDAFELDRVLFLPAGRPSHKKSPAASARDRLAMVRQAIRGNPRFLASAWDIEQQRPVYTFETLAYFKTLYPRAALFFILGSDSLRDIPGWRQGAALLRLCRFLVIERIETPWSSLPIVLRRQAARVPAPLCQISSHEIRANVKEMSSIRYRVPERVALYIRRKRLYKGNPR